MAKKTIVEIIDDIDGEPIDSGGETISFAVNGIEYSIDLNGKNAIEFHRKLDYYIRHAERVGGRKRANASKASTGGVSMSEVRAWAKANSHPIGDKGRIPADVLAAYENAH